MLNLGQESDAMYDPIMNAIRWNVSSTRLRFAKADAIIVSVPKSGRTWLRVFLYSYFSALHNREFSLREQDFADGEIPKLVFTHDLFEHAREPNFLHRLRGRNLIPPPERRAKPTVLMVRDPRDVMVSWYFHLTKRKVRRKFDGSLREMIEDPTFGIKVIVDIMNAWIGDWSGRAHFKLLRYEDCRLNPEKAFREVLHFLGFKDIHESVLARSVEFSSFDNMKTMETEGKFAASILSPGNVKDPNSFKVRRGKVGGYREYFSPEEIHSLEKALDRLDPRYGYNRESSAL